MRSAMSFQTIFNRDELFVGHSETEDSMLQDLPCEVLMAILSYIQPVDRISVAHQSHWLSSIVFQCDITVLDWLYNTTDINPSREPEIFLDALCRGDIDVVKWLNEEKGCTFGSAAHWDVAHSGRIEIMHWMMSREFHKKAPLDMWLGAISGGWIHVLEWLYDRDGIIQDHITRASLSSGFLDIIQWLMNRRRLDPCDDLIREALQCRLYMQGEAMRSRGYGRSVPPDGIIQTVEWLITHHECQLPLDVNSNWILLHSYDAMCLSLIRWIQSSRPAPAGALRMAIERRNVTVSDYLFSQGHLIEDDMCDVAIFSNERSMSEEENIISILDWLHRHHATWDQEIYSRIALSGHFSILHWLLSRDHPLKTWTHVDSLDWLRSHGYTIHHPIFYYAWRNVSGTQVLEWLDENGYDWSVCDARDALEGGRIEDAVWIIQHGGRLSAVDAFLDSLEFGNVEVLVWLHDGGHLDGEMLKTLMPYYHPNKQVTFWLRSYSQIYGFNDRTMTKRRVLFPCDFVLSYGNVGFCHHLVKKSACALSFEDRPKCAGLRNRKCPDGYVCSASFPRSGHCNPSVCGGFLGKICPEGFMCQYGANETTPIADEQGVCVKKPPARQCGGIGALKCPAGFFCRVSPNVATHPDMSGTCEPRPDVIVCGGLQGRTCPSGYACQLDANTPDATGVCQEVDDGDCVMCADIVPQCPPVCAEGTNLESKSPDVYAARTSGCPFLPTPTHIEVSLLNTRPAPHKSHDLPSENTLLPSKCSSCLVLAVVSAWIENWRRNQDDCGPLPIYEPSESQSRTLTTNAPTKRINMTTSAVSACMFELDKREYHPNSVITGRIHFSPKHKTDFYAVWIYLRGSIILPGQLQNSKKKKIPFLSQYLIINKLEGGEEQPVGKSVVLQAGEYSSPFTIVLPGNDLLPTASYHHGKISVRYHLHAYIDTWGRREQSVDEPWKNAIKAKTEISVVVPYTLKDIDLTQRLHVKQKLFMGPQEKSPLEIEAQPERNITWQKDQFKMMIRIINNSNRKVDHVVIKLKQVWRYTMKSAPEDLSGEFIKGSGSASITNVIDRKEYHDLNLSSGNLYQGICYIDVNLPQLNQPTIDNCKVLSLTYDVIVRCHMSSGVKSTLRFPVRMLGQSIDPPPSNPLPNADVPVMVPHQHQTSLFSSNLFSRPKPSKSGLAPAPKKLQTVMSDQFDAARGVDTNIGHLERARYMVMVGQTHQLIMMPDNMTYKDACYQLITRIGCLEKNMSQVMKQVRTETPKKELSKTLKTLGRHQEDLMEGVLLMTSFIRNLGVQQDVLSSTKCILLSMHQIVIICSHSNMKSGDSAFSTLLAVAWKRFETAMSDLKNALYMAGNEGGSIVADISTTHKALEEQSVTLSHPSSSLVLSGSSSEKLPTIIQLSRDLTETVFTLLSLYSVPHPQLLEQIESITSQVMEIVKNLVQKTIEYNGISTAEEPQQLPTIIQLSRDLTETVFTLLSLYSVPHPQLLEQIESITSQVMEIVKNLVQKTIEYNGISTAEEPQQVDYLVSRIIKRTQDLLAEVSQNTMTDTPPTHTMGRLLRSLESLQNVGKKEEEKEEEEETEPNQFEDMCVALEVIINSFAPSAEGSSLGDSPSNATRMTVIHSLRNLVQPLLHISAFWRDSDLPWNNSQSREHIEQGRKEVMKAVTSLISSIEACQEPDNFITERNNILTLIEKCIMRVGKLNTFMMSLVACYSEREEEETIDIFHVLRERLKQVACEGYHLEKAFRQVARRHLKDKEDATNAQKNFLSSSAWCSPDIHTKRNVEASDDTMTMSSLCRTNSIRQRFLNLQTSLSRTSSSWSVRHSVRETKT
ncbi:hypothetical protein PROFUN_04212 [Planoprotostelium fungivorum]|uniref:Arrestin-like N-terminal domain-containing protein n=1 Tax=Planoprotostelium fungivorum TaxID=1890364 RepID=A0A2P6NVX2_9EUKA|nr:hypothetical protein PROFUN_04212 [Planoprotostelium fungivorum]